MIMTKYNILHRATDTSALGAGGRVVAPNIYLRACVCMYVCMYVCIYVCIFACIIMIIYIYVRPSRARWSRCLGPDPIADCRLCGNFRRRRPSQQPRFPSRPPWPSRRRVPAPRRASLRTVIGQIDWSKRPNIGQTDWSNWSKWPNIGQTDWSNWSKRPNIGQTDWSDWSKRPNIGDRRRRVPARAREGKPRPRRPRGRREKAALCARKQ